MSANDQDPIKAQGRKRKIQFESMTEEQSQQWREELDQRRARLDAKMEEKRKAYDPVIEDRKQIGHQLQSGTSIFVLEYSKSARSHCRAKFCIPSELQGYPNIDSHYRLNLKDTTGNMAGVMSHWERKS
jgi:hypothetical protein